ncbi:PHB depolymerase family esterase [Clostridium sp. C2-6-12]|uniref:PHB depolymerase family esterase n=1 Tax=Clostridium sp. C2-6-12 TaxID=2698832 RepID=UPI00136CB2A9|nr:PHB depolymerase family esterase [Clostridium sp. C2-6-12]
MKRKIIKLTNLILTCITIIFMFIIIPNNVFATEQKVLVNTNTSLIKSMPSQLKDATYIGITDPDNDLISYRLKVTMKGGKITNANFYMCFDGCEYTAGTPDYLLKNQWMGMKNPQRRARFQSMEETFNSNSKAAMAYNEKLVGLNSPDELPKTSDNQKVFQALQLAWNNITENQLMVVEHRDESLGDNNNVNHSWNEYIPKYVQEHPSIKVPMVIVLHAAGNNIEQAEGLGFPYVGAKENFITVIPSSTKPGVWNELNYNLTPYNDEDFLLKLIEHEKNNYSIDTEKVYMSGISLGASMTADMGILHPEIFAGIDIVAGGFSVNSDSATDYGKRIQKKLSEGLTRLPIIYGVGTDDCTNFSMKTYDSKRQISSEFEPSFNIFKKMNNVPTATFNNDYIFGAPLNNNQSVDKYGYTLNTGVWYSNDDPLNADYIMMCTINEMWHSNPNPYYAQMSWDYLKKFSRKADGTLINLNNK